jgi:hypothetical protein
MANSNFGAIGSALAITPGQSMRWNAAGNAWEAYTPSMVPTGGISQWPGTGASAGIPTGFLNCDGSAVSRSTYAALYAVISTYYGAGDGSTTFNVPNLKDVVIAGACSQASNLPVTNFSGSGCHSGGCSFHTHCTNNSTADCNLDGDIMSVAISICCTYTVPPYKSMYNMIKT